MIIDSPLSTDISSLPNSELIDSLQAVVHDLDGTKPLPIAHSFSELEQILSSDD